MNTPKKTSSVNGEDFPYGSSSVVYVEIAPDGSISQGKPSRNALLRAYNGESRMFAIWTGKWSSNMFEVDDLDRCALEMGFEQFSENIHRHDIVWRENDYDSGSGQTADISLKLKCSCEISSIKAFAVEAKDSLGWYVRVSKGWGSGGGTYSLCVGRKSLQSKASQDSRSKDSL